MLKKLKEYLIAKNEPKSFEENTKSMVRYILVFVVGFVVILIMNAHRNKNYEQMKDTYNDNINKISDNYTLEIKLYKGEEEYTLEYKTDSIIGVYSSETFSKTEYISYNNELFYLENDKIVKTDFNEINGIFDNKLYNLKLLTNLIKSSNGKFNRYKTKYNIKMNDFFNEYNKLFNDNINPTLEDDIILDVNHDEKSIKSIAIVYDSVIKVLTNEVNETEYVITLKNLNSTDNSEYYKYFEENNN